MPVNNRRKRQARILRRTRRLHRWSGIVLFVFFFIVGVTSVLLGWKKNSTLLMPPTQRGSTVELRDWLPAEELLRQAQLALTDSLGSRYSTEIDRMDYRPAKGIVKFLFKNHLQEVQLDGATGELLSIGARRADLIENIHDGSVIDNYLGLKGSPVKIVYSSVMGLGLLVFTVTGFWLWYGPKQMRRR